MKEWIVIHKIKSLYDNGNGLTERQIATELGLSRNTVSKYPDCTGLWGVVKFDM
jgi:DNA-binding transcriptional regulator LsrR (DeoR family)